MADDPAQARAAALAARVRAGDPAALARALTLAENGCEPLMRLLRPAAGKADVVGVTGPPGAGKSTLVSALVSAWRAAGRRVAVLAVDPASPFSGGAVLGDRTRMGAHSMDKGVFVRSVSARGHLGGLAAGARDMIDAMDAAGWDLILVETVGAGQSEVEVARAADVRLVVLAPGLGDDLQAIKAGILEIADILVVNKADRPEADVTARQLDAMLALRSATPVRPVPVLRCAATTGDGIEPLRAAIDGAALAARPDRPARRHDQLRHLLAEIMARQMRAAVLDCPALDSVLARLSAGEGDLDGALADVRSALDASAARRDQT
ncbi:MAG: methylmalonyl Co-A mutase-associated GTPase MeaB [Pararhodobacter sp.]|nr:methylmalonyl Co-A mutase-associated GTPase MeaB [Pararhodobacter sp.]